MTRVLSRTTFTLITLALYLPALTVPFWAPLWVFFVLIFAPSLFVSRWSPDRRWNLPRRKPVATPTVTPVPCDCPGCCGPATEAATTVAPCCGEDAAPGCCEPLIILRKDDNPV